MGLHVLASGLLLLTQCVALFAFCLFARTVGGWRGGIADASICGIEDLDTLLVRVHFVHLFLFEKALALHVLLIGLKRRLGDRAQAARQEYSQDKNLLHCFPLNTPQIRPMYFVGAGVNSVKEIARRCNAAGLAGNYALKNGLIGLDRRGPLLLAPLRPEAVSGCCLGSRRSQKSREF